MMPRPTLAFFFSFLVFSFVSAQNTWSLEKCINYARENSLNVKRAQYNIELAQLSEKENRFSRLPNLNGSVSLGTQFGRTIDPTTNSFIQENVTFNSYSLNAGILLYNGNVVNNSIRQSRLNLEASNLDAQATANDISLNVASAYLSILLAEEQVENARKQLELSQRQLEQTDKLIAAGSIPRNDRLDFLAQIARNEQAIIEAQNLVNINYLTLKQLLEVDPREDIRIARPEVVIPVDANPEIFRLEEVYTTALGTQPQIKAGEKRVESARLDEKIALSSALPRLSLFGSLSTNYSSRFPDFAKPINPQLELSPPTPVVLNGEPAAVQFFQTTNDGFPTKKFGSQINENFGQSAGINLSIPIYNNHRNRVSMERAKVNMLTADLNNRQAKQQLKADVQRAIADARAAMESYQAAQRSVDAAQAALDNAQKRFDLGVINTLEYTTANNNLERAKVELIRSKYQYLFNLKVVDFYLGREIQLN